MRMKTQHRVLLVDDDRGFTGMLKLNLETLANFRVRVENDPARAVEAALDFRPDLIMLDVIMHGKEGGEVAVELREHPELEGVPVIFLTATVTKLEVEEQEGGRIGGRRFVAKPIDLDELVRVIGENLNGKPV
jgi:DNA-binding response OmpR family regulator